MKSTTVEGSLFNMKKKFPKQIVSFHTHIWHAPLVTHVKLHFGAFKYEIGSPLW